MATEDKRIDQLPAVTSLDLTSLMALQQSGNAKKVTLQQLLNYLNDNISPDNVVLFVSQSLTSTQQAQARTNIGAAASGEIPTGVVKYTTQTLTDAQKLQARTNIGAAAPGEGGGSAANAVLYVEQTLTEDQQHQARLNIRCGSVGEVDVSCVASGFHAHAEGYNATASNESCHAEGHTTKASGWVSHAEGHTTKASGDYSHAEGYTTEASGKYSHAEGYEATASGKYSHAEGQYTTASGLTSHAEGLTTKASGDYSHAEGSVTTASGFTSHAEGYNATALGDYSHVEGNSTKASGKYSHAEGYRTTAASRTQHVQGSVNIEDAEGKYVHIVGNGHVEEQEDGEIVKYPSNAHTLDWAGVPWFAGDRVMLGGTGMDDENAVALMPIFVAQTLTDAQKLQARTNIGAIGADDLTTEVEEALTAAKESGEFDGAPGYTPVRGTDYWTAADIAEIKSYVDDAILGGEW